MAEYTAPKVTIDLAEYEELKANKSKTTPWQVGQQIIVKYEGSSDYIPFRVIEVSGAGKCYMYKLSMGMTIMVDK